MTGAARSKHYVKRTGDLICERIANGDTLQEALDAVGYLAPTPKRFWEWLEAHPDFRDQYDRARQLQADMHADEMVGYAKKAIANPKSATAYKVAADIMRWSAEVRNPGKYGKKIAPPKRDVLSPEKIRQEIARLEKALGVMQQNNVVPLKGNAE